jgi:REP element-mobilizing transposase RayT
MPATNDAYSHFWNLGIENREIFRDQKDYEVFLDFINDYLTQTRNLESLKKEFVVKGRTYQGTPHLPKNFADKVKLIAFSLMPNHFHLILQGEPGFPEKFVRALLTRYSIYFNKKYKRSGTLFQGPYKVVAVKNEHELPLLIKFIHQGSKHSSSEDYSGNNVHQWVNIIPEHKENLEKTSLDDENINQIEQLISETKEAHLSNNPLAKTQETQDTNEAEIEKVQYPIEPKPPSMLPHYLAIIGVFFILLTIGINNVRTISAQKQKGYTGETNVLGTVTQISPSPEASQTPLISPTPFIDSHSSVPTPTPIPDIFVTVSTTNNSNVNIHSSPSLDAKVIGKAVNGETLKLISKEPGWYEVQLINGATGFISDEYIIENINTY